MFSIPKAGQIDVPDAPDITPLVFYKQIIENINSQLENVDKELQKAAKGDNAYVWFYLFSSVILGLSICTDIIYIWLL